MIKISIIIPVYNTEQYIAKCLDSCLSQSVDQGVYEIIVVNDGSTDSSLNIAKSFEVKFNNITVISQKNKKQGAARNNGLKISKGEYIWFVDSDDWIEPNACEEVLKIVKQNKVEILRFDAVDHKPNNQKKVRACKHIPGYIYQQHEALLEDQFSVCVPFYVFKREFLIQNELKFIEGIFFEDNEFMIRALVKAQTFFYIEKHYYNVYLHQNSTTRTTDCQRYTDNILVLKSHIDFIENNNLTDDVIKVFSKRIACSMNSALIGTIKSPHIFKSTIEKLKNVNDLPRYIKMSDSIFHFIEYYLLKYPKTLKFMLNIYYFKCSWIR